MDTPFVISTKKQNTLSASAKEISEPANLEPPPTLINKHMIGGDANNLTQYWWIIIVVIILIIMFFIIRRYENNKSDTPDTTDAGSNSNDQTSSSNANDQTSNSNNNIELEVQKLRDKQNALKQF